MYCVLLQHSDLRLILTCQLPLWNLCCTIAFDGNISLPCCVTWCGKRECWMFSCCGKVEPAAGADLRAAEEQQSAAGPVAALQVAVQPVRGGSAETGGARRSPAEERHRQGHHGGGEQRLDEGLQREWRCSVVLPPFFRFLLDLGTIRQNDSKSAHPVNQSLRPALQSPSMHPALLLCFLKADSQHHLTKAFRMWRLRRQSGPWFTLQEVERMSRWAWKVLLGVF